MKEVSEWSIEFDVHYNNIISNQAPGLNEYEKSVYLTRGEEGLVLDFFSAKSNAMQEGISDSPRRMADFQSLMRTKGLTKILTPTTRFDQRGTSQLYEVPSDVLFVLNESYKEVLDGDTKYYSIVPLAADEYSRLMMRPYKYPPRDQLWRIQNHYESIHQEGESGSESDTFELIGRFRENAIGTYHVRYVKRPDPIILVNLATDFPGFKINGKTAVATCTLPEHLHQEIMQRAVLLAKMDWIDITAQQPRQQQQQ